MEISVSANNQSSPQAKIALFRSFFQNVTQRQGAIHVRNALLDYVPNLRERILVAAFASATWRAYNRP